MSSSSRANGSASWTPWPRPMRVPRLSSLASTTRCPACPAVISLPCWCALALISHHSSLPSFLQHKCLLRPTPSLYGWCGFSCILSFGSSVVRRTWQPKLWSGPSARVWPKSRAQAGYDPASCTAKAVFSCRKSLAPAVAQAAPPLCGPDGGGRSGPTHSRTKDTLAARTGVSVMAGRTSTSRSSGTRLRFQRPHVGGGGATHRRSSSSHASRSMAPIARP